MAIGKIEKVAKTLGIRGFIRPKNIKVLDETQLSFFDSCVRQLKELNAQVLIKIRSLDNYTRDKKYEVLRKINKFENIFRGVRSYVEHYNNVESSLEVVKSISANFTEIYNLLEQSKKKLLDIQKTDIILYKKIEKDIEILNKIIKDTKKIDGEER
jgi:hypothetical protein